MSYFVLGEGFGCEFQSQYLKWIYFAPGRKFEEGLLSWGDETLGVVPWVDGQPKHYFRNATQIIKELIDCGIVEILKSKVLPERPQKAWQGCPHQNTKKNGTNRAGTQRYRCKDCGATFVPDGQHGGHNRIDDGLTPQQRQNEKRKLQIQSKGDRTLTCTPTGNAVSSTNSPRP